MRISNQEEIESPPNLMPLIDMVFLLLIFFLVASSFTKEEREQGVQLPRTSKTIKPMSAIPRQLIINILHDGSMKIEGQTIERKKLKGALESLVRNQPDRKVLIRCDDRARFKYFAGVLDLSAACGINPVQIGYLAYEPRATVIPD